MAKDLFNRYLWLVDTIYRAGTITLDEINRKWLQCEMSNGEKSPIGLFIITGKLLRNYSTLT